MNRFLFVIYAEKELSRGLPLPHRSKERVKPMKPRVPMTSALALCFGMLLTPVQMIQAQNGPAAQKIEQLAKQLKLTPQQKLQLAPILEAEAPKAEAIKG